MTLVFLSLSLFIHNTFEMETTYDSWLEYLVKHPIFDLDDAEKRCSQTMQSKQTRQDSHVVNYLLQHHARVMAVRDNDLFVAIASHIRVLNLSYFKDNWLKAAKEANAKQEPLSDSWMLSTPYKVGEHGIAHTLTHLLLLS